MERVAAEFTPGPWQMVTHGSGLGFGVSQSFGVGTKQIASNLREADASLIAAAPDGHSLAEWIEQNYANHMSHEGFRVEAFTRATEYLAKARGGAK